MMDTEDLSDFMRRLPIFSFCNDDELIRLATASRLKSVEPDEIIFQEGEPGDTLYVVFSGRVRILKTNVQNRQVNLGLRTRGDHLGETALLTGEPRNASAQAVDHGVLICVDRDAFNEFLLGKPEWCFDKFIRYTSVHTFLKSCTELAEIPPGDLQKLADSLRSEFFKKGDVVFRQGAEPDMFYLMEEGKAKVVRWEGKRQETINFLHEGDFFGEKALIEASLRHADVVCLTDCHVFSLTREAFDALVKESPSMRRVIEDRIRSYSIEIPPIPRRETVKHRLAASEDVEVRDESPTEGLTAGGRKRFLRILTSFFRRAAPFPFVPEDDPAASGIACLMMVARYYGKTFSSSRLRDLAHADVSGCSVNDLAAAAEKIGFSSRAIKLDFERLLDVDLPAIVHWQGYRYAVVHRVNSDTVWVSDPALGSRKCDRERFEENWNGITLSMKPTPELERQEEDKSSLRNFMLFLRPYKMVLLEVLLASVLLNAFGLASPIFTQKIIDNVVTHNNVSMLNIMLIGMLIVLVFRTMTGIVRQYLIVNTSMKIDLTMLVVFYKHLLSLPLGYFKARRVGDFITRFGENMRIRNFLTNTAMSMVLDTVLIVVYLSLMFYYNIQMTVIALVFTPVFIGLTLCFTPMLKRLNSTSFVARAECESHLIESINGIETIKALNIEHPTRWRWENKFIKSLNIDFRLYNTGLYFQSFGDFLGTLSSTIILWYGAHKVMQGAISVGELMAFMALLGSVVAPIDRMINVWDDIQQTLVSVDRLNDVLTARSEFRAPAEEPPGVIIKEPRGEVIFEGVSFRYGGKDSPDILSNIEFKISAGQTVAIVGRSGSGKTTLVRLIARLYDVTDGRILIDGYDVRNIDLSYLRRIVGYVLQESFIFSGTVRENISLNDPNENMEKVMQAAQLANAHDFIASLEFGYDTQVGESGLQLSGGQRQRIAIARVLYARPMVLILDEATSSLDTESETAIQKNLGIMLKGKTAIVIAHRLSTVRNADRIIVLDEGRIVEQGRHEELMAQKGLYHYLNHQQLNL